MLELLFLYSLVVSEFAKVVEKKVLLWEETINESSFGHRYDRKRFITKFWEQVCSRQFLSDELTHCWETHRTAISHESLRPWSLHVVLGTVQRSVILIVEDPGSSLTTVGCTRALDQSRCCASTSCYFVRKWCNSRYSEFTLWQSESQKMWKGGRCVCTADNNKQMTREQHEFLDATKYGRLPCLLPPIQPLPAI